jgi:2-polyprenyl-3-methyl-5-hydroxy-6-metoxy-1,4-benzoquinol methylase
MAPKCVVCSSQDTLLVWSRNNLCIFYCKNCGVSFLDPRLDFPYENKYFLENYIRYKKIRDEYFKALISSPILLQYFTKNKKILDVGCGVGIFANVAETIGCSIEGIDTSIFASSYCKDNFSFPVYTKLEDVPANRYDIVTLWDVLGHIQQPALFLKQCLKVLKTQGCVIIKTPNYHLGVHLITRVLNPFFDTKGIFHIPAQINYFNRDSIVHLFKISGLENIKIHGVEDVKIPVSRIRIKLFNFYMSFLGFIGTPESLVCIGEKVG